MSVSRRAFMAGAGAALAAPAFAHDPVHEVAIRGFAFQPAALTVRAGDHIRFANHDLAPHTATATDGSWDTGPLQAGESVTLTVDKEWGGTYFCVFHPHMTARLSVGS